MNGFTTGRLLEPKTKLFLDKVFSESEAVFGEKGVTEELHELRRYYMGKDTWMGIIRINSTTYQGNKWVYASSGDDLEFQNWYSGKPRYGALDGAECTLLHTGTKWKNHPSWFDQVCYSKNAFICEFV